MTVAACILAASAASALADIEGRTNIRRIVEAAWAGGALPVIVVTPDADGRTAAALAGSPAVMGEPAPFEAGPVGQISRAIDLARAETDATSAALVWPARMGWVDAETVTSLIEAHGAAPDLVLRPAFDGQAGWPLLVPVQHLEALRAQPANLMPDDLAAALEALVPSLRVETGDPGVTHAIEVAREDLPPFQGPPEPPADSRREWGSAAALEPDGA